MAQGLSRGDLILAALPGDYGKPRPAVVVQNMDVLAGESVIICPLTSTVLSPGPIRPTITPTEANGLRLTSQIMVDKITTLKIEKAGPRIGSLAAADLIAVAGSLAKLLAVPVLSTDEV